MGQERGVAPSARQGGGNALTAAKMRRKRGTSAPGSAFASPCACFLLPIPASCASGSLHTVP